MKKTRSKLIQKLAARLAVPAIIALAASNALAAGTNVVIVEAYGGGGNSGSTYKNDFIGLFNRGTTPVDVTGWSVQYASSAGSSWAVTPLTSVTIPAGGYYLIQETNGAGGTVNLPTPDTIGGISMGATGFKVALVASTTPLTGASPTGSPIVDFVGASGGASSFEGTGPAQTPSNTTSDQRKNNGCTDTDDNTNDFVAAAPNPRNSSTPLHSCAIVIAPVISGVIPTSLTTNAGNAVTFTVSLSQGDAPLYYQWYTQSADTLTSTPIANATNASLVLPSVLEADATNYVVVVTNNAASANSVTSSPVTLAVIDPAINVQPSSQQALPNGSAQFLTLDAGTAISYQWYFCASASDNSQLTGIVSDGLLPSGAGALGSTSDTLTITNATVNTQTNFALVVAGTFGSITSSVASLTVGTTAVPLAFWNFNGIFDPTNPAPFQGIATALSVSVDPFVQPNRDGNDITPGNNLAWGTQNYPAGTSSNKQTGVQFNVSTVGARHIKLSFDLRATATASKYQRLQYTTNGTDFVDYPASQAIATAQSGTYNGYSYDLTGFPGVRNNPRFGLRMVTEFENTATYNNTNDANYVAVSGSYGTAGTVSYDIVEFTGDAITDNNQPPTVGAIPAQTAEDTIGTNVTFTVSDDSTPAGSLSVSAASLDPSTSVSFSTVNTSGSVKLTISPNLGLSAPKTVPVLVTVTDGGGEFTVQSFLLTITPANSPPVVTGLINTNMLTNATLVIPFTVADDHTPASSITTSVTSGNSTVVPNDVGHVSIGGSGGSRTLTITPVAGQSGAVPITVSAMDSDGLVTLQAFYVEVRPNINVMLIDNFDYDTAGALINVSAGLWQHHSGTTPAQLLEDTHVATINNVANTEDINAALFGAPYLTNQEDNVTLYASYTLHYTTLPNGTNGSYITHFKDNTTSGFLGRVWASTNVAAAGTYRLGIGNSTVSSSTNAQLAQDLALATDYTVVVRIRLTNGFCTLWVNPTSETTGGVTDTTVVTNLVDIYAYAFRENTGGGIANVDNLKVGTSFQAVTGIASTPPPPPAPTISTISVGGPGGTNIIITGTNNNGTTTTESFVVLSSTNIALPLSNWTSLGTQPFNPDGSFNFTNGMTSDSGRFYLLQALP